MCNGIKSENIWMNTYYKIYSIEVGFASRAGAAGVLVRGLCKIFFYWLHPSCRLILSVWFPLDQPYQQSLYRFVLFISHGPTLSAKSYRFVLFISLRPTLSAKCLQISVWFIFVRMRTVDELSMIFWYHNIMYSIK